MTERRYSEEELAAIFERATEAQKSGGLQHSRDREGFTLSELEEIAREAGISPERVARAARDLEHPSHGSTRRLAGLPLGVGLTVQLDRKLTDEEWERLVVDLRQTFDARGKLRTDGPFREWSNGNLQALVEPTPEGDRVRLRTLKGSARALMTSGSIMAAVGVIVALVAVLTSGGPGSEQFEDGLLVSLIGLGLFTFSAIRLPGWARLRRRQMEAVAERLQRAVESTESSSEGSPSPDHSTIDRKQGEP